MNTKTFQTKIDSWIPVLLVGGIGVGIFYYGVPTLPEILVLVGVVVAFGAMALTTRYDVGDEDLAIKLGPITLGRIPLPSITEIHPTHNPLSAPAFSLDRLRINYRRPNGKMSFGLASPRDKEGFLNAIVERVPNLKRDGMTIRQIASGQSI